MMATDIDRLHKVAGGELYGRQVGKTYLKCHEICGLVGCNEPEIIVLITHERDRGYIIDMLQSIVTEYNYQLVRSGKYEWKIEFIEDEHHTPYVSSTRITFIPTGHDFMSSESSLHTALNEYHVYRKISGQRNAVIVPMGHYD